METIHVRRNASLSALEAIAKNGGQKLFWVPTPEVQQSMGYIAAIPTGEQTFTPISTVRIEIGGDPGCKAKMLSV